jgi:hypothetical protein
LGWLMTGRAADGDGQVAVRNGAGPSVTAWFSTMEPVRALITTLAAGTEFSAGQLFQVGDEAHAGAGVLRRAHLHGAPVQRGGGALPSGR